MIVAFGFASPKDELASSIAFFCADEPSPFRVPLTPEPEPAAVSPPEPLSSEPQAVSASAPARTTLVSAACRGSFKAFPFRGAGMGPDLWQMMTPLRRLRTPCGAP